MIPQEYFDKVKKFYGGDEKKTWDWFKDINPHFGMLSPLNAIKLGKGEKVKSFIDTKLK